MPLQLLLLALSLPHRVPTASPSARVLHGRLQVPRLFSPDKLGSSDQRGRPLVAKLQMAGPVRPSLSQGCTRQAGTGGGEASQGDKASSRGAFMAMGWG